MYESGFQLMTIIFAGILWLHKSTVSRNLSFLHALKKTLKKRLFLTSIVSMYCVLFQNDDSTYGFETPSRQACKHLWKCCVEHHAFFRLVQVRKQQSLLRGYLKTTIEGQKRINKFKHKKYFCSALLCRTFLQFD